MIALIVICVALYLLGAVAVYEMTFDQTYYTQREFMISAAVVFFWPFIVLAAIVARIKARTKTKQDVG